MSCLISGNCGWCENNSDCPFPLICSLKDNRCHSCSMDSSIFGPHCTFPQNCLEVSLSQFPEAIQDLVFQSNIGHTETNYTTYCQDCRSNASICTTWGMICNQLDGSCLNCLDNPDLVQCPTGKSCFSGRSVYPGACLFQCVNDYDCPNPRDICLPWGECGPCNLDGFDYCSKPDTLCRLNHHQFSNDSYFSCLDCTSLLALDICPSPHYRCDLATKTCKNCTTDPAMCVAPETCINGRCEDCQTTPSPATFCPSPYYCLNKGDRKTNKSICVTEYCDNDN